MVVGGFNVHNQFESNIIAFNSVTMEWTDISHAQRIPCKPPPLGYQTSCALVFIQYSSLCLFRLRLFSKLKKLKDTDITEQTFEVKQE